MTTTGWAHHYIGRPATATAFAVTACRMRTAAIGSQDATQVTCKRCLAILAKRAAKRAAVTYQGEGENK